MKKYLSPGNLIVTAGGILAFVGMTAYFTDSVNLSVPTFFYGVPIFLKGQRLIRNASLDHFFLPL